PGPAEWHPAQLRPQRGHGRLRGRAGNRHPRQQRPPAPLRRRPRARAVDGFQAGNERQELGQLDSQRPAGNPHQALRPGLLRGLPHRAGLLPAGPRQKGGPGPHSHLARPAGLSGRERLRGGAGPALGAAAGRGLTFGTFFNLQFSIAVARLPGIATHPAIAPRGREGRRYGHKPGDLPFATTKDVCPRALGQQSGRLNGG
nr:hypothetical protein [Tanacetum cinerariifolium]